MNDNRWSANVALRSGLGAREQSGAGGSMSSGTSGGGMLNGESGILRKPGGLAGVHFNPHHPSYQHHDNFADLLVFGYSCKVFRDDEKARFIDQGRHLIPWMGDNQLKIDRYDARGALHDLSQHEPPLGGYGNRLDCLSPAEQRAEQLCEEERYHSLYINEVEEEIQQEEAAKRQAASGAEIAFDYDAQPSATVVGPEPAAPDDENSSDPPFVAPVNFEIPADLDRPETMKEHAIIEKTAKFIASQDSQMEILLRAKQAGNPQFDFLSPGGRLYRYYRHVLMAIKTNQYPEDVPEEDSNDTEEAEAVEASATAAETSPEKPKVIVPAIKYKPSIDCAYTQLISKITGAPIPTKESSGVTSPGSPTVPLNPTQATAFKAEAENIPEEKPVEVKKVSTGLAGLVQYDSDSEESGNEEEAKKEKKSEPETEKREITFSGALPPEIFQHVIEKTATYVAKNGYSFEEALRTKNDPRFLFLRKDHEFYPFYAFRVRYLINPFEEVPKSPEKVTITREIENGTVVETPSIGIKTVNTAPVPVPAPQTQIQANKPGGAVCFSIKSKDDATVALKSNVVQELGGDEEEAEPAANEQEKEKSKSPAPASENPAPTKEKSVEKEVTAGKEKEIKEGSTTPPPASQVVAQPVVELQSSTPPLEDSKPANTSPDSAVDGGSKDQKRLEDRIKDKLAVAARERLASIAKEKQLQLERKKRASMFLSLINKNEPSRPDSACDELPPPAQQESREATPPTPELPPSTAPTAFSKNGLELLKKQFSDNEGDGDEDAEEEGSNDSSNLSVHSVPSGSDSAEPSSAEDDVVFVAENNAEGRPSRSRTRSKSVSSSSKPKKRKHKHKSKSKKSKKKKSDSRSRSRTPSKSRSKSKRKRSRSRSKSSRRSRSRSPLEKDPKKAKKKKSKKSKSHKRSKSSRSSSITSRHHRKEHREKNEWESD